MKRHAHRENKTKQKKEAFVCHYGWAWIFASASFRRHKNPVRCIFDLMMIKKKTPLICVLRIFSLWYVLSLSKLCSRLDVHTLKPVSHFCTLLCFFPHHCNFVKNSFCVNIPTGLPSPNLVPCYVFATLSAQRPFSYFSNLILVTCRINLRWSSFPD